MALFYQGASDLPSRVRASLGGYMGGNPPCQLQIFFLISCKLKELRPKVFPLSLKKI